ncbi:uncharacterized protein N7459_001232 [Penicillium hispanicum]|uniref:uncharacterized protein n=1 Tax=Penicillium hispanicum TaxID=1080232 RepID=UPI00253FE572|nr:uncharacterized protein N7459_001232 [Penicillium hispanicum]KAJ5595024.1 hypothetical protein N7459_001232 [Penicillium hispanicum]
MSSRCSSSDSPPITPPDYLQAYLEYNSLQTEGDNCQRWISDPSIPCPIPSATLLFGALSSPGGWRTLNMRDGPPTQVAKDVEPLGFAIDGGAYRQISVSKVAMDMATDAEHCLHVVTIHAGEGILTIDDIERQQGYKDPPYTSEIIKALYQNSFNVDTLKHIYVCDIVHRQTKEFVSQTLYSAMNDLYYPQCSEARAWEYGTPEYQALLGTRIGKVVAYFVLGTYSRGTRRIGSIVTWHTSSDARHLQMRFDIENRGMI